MADISQVLLICLVVRVDNWQGSLVVKSIWPEFFIRFSQPLLPFHLGFGLVFLRVEHMQVLFSVVFEAFILRPSILPITNAAVPRALVNSPLIQAPSLVIKLVVRR